MTVDLQPPEAGELLAAWERGLQSESARGTVLLEAVGGGHQDTGSLPLGQRNRLLLSARVLLFGPCAEVVAPCADCGERLEEEVSLLALLDGLAPGSPGPVAVRSRGYDVSLRLPTAADLSDLPPEVEMAARALLARCVVTARHEAADVDPEELPKRVVRAVDEALAEADPAASIELTTACPECGTASSLVLDPVGLLWAEVDAWAWRMLAEVSSLAGAYGWSEADVLAMSPTRRQAYLHLSGAGEGAL